MCPNAKVVSRQSPRVPERSHDSFWKGFHSLLWKWIVSLLWVSYPQQLVLWTLSFVTVLGPYNGWNTRLHSTQISYFALEGFARSPAALVSIVVVVICHVSWESENASSEQTANFGTPPPPHPSLSLTLTHTHVHLPLSPINRMRFLWLSSPVKISKRAYWQFVQHFTSLVTSRERQRRQRRGERGGEGWGGVHSFRPLPLMKGPCRWMCMRDGGGGGGTEKDRDRDRERERGTDWQTKTERDERLIRYITDIPIISDITLKEKKKKQKGGGGREKKKRGGGLRILFQFPLLYWTFVTYYMDTMTVISWR